MSDVPLAFKFIDECRMTQLACLRDVKIAPECSLGPSYHLRVLVASIFHPRHSCIAHVDFHNNHTKFSFSISVYEVHSIVSRRCTSPPSHVSGQFTSPHTPKYRQSLADSRCDSFLSLRVLHWHKDTTN